MPQHPSPYLQPDAPHPHGPHAGHHPVPWGVLSDLIEGRSVVEQAGIRVQSVEEAHRLAQGYGYHLNDAEDAAALHHLLGEAIHFIENRLLEPGAGEAAFERLGLHLPEEFLEHHDVVELLMMASRQPRDEMARWACAILKVLHMLVHIENTPRLQVVHHARQQILEAYNRALRHLPETNQVQLGRKNSPKTLALYGIEIKEQKTRDSLLIKVLSKKDNLVEVIDDLIGLRLVTESIPDVLVALDILVEEQLLVFSNVKSQRSRNTLIELEEFRALWNRLHATEAHPHKASRNPWSELMQTLTRLDARLPQHSFAFHNPNSSSRYRALHLTARHLVKVPNQAAGSPMQRLFFPYEIQLIDKHHYIANQEGDVAHSRYKQRQLQQARVRVLGDLLPPAFRRAPSPQQQETHLRQPFEAKDTMRKRNLEIDDV